MWDTPFDESMLYLPEGVVIHCPEEGLAKELFEIFKEHGTAQNWRSLEDTKWYQHEERTAYFVRGKEMLYGPTRDAEGRESSCYSRYTKCTYYGIDVPDFDAATDDEIRTFLGFGGG